MAWAGRLVRTLMAAEGHVVALAAKWRTICGVEVARGNLLSRVGRPGPAVAMLFRMSVGS
jgi:hypothetical protein